MILLKHANTNKIIATNFYVYTTDLDQRFFYPVQSNEIDYFLLRHPFDRLMDIYLFEIKLSNDPLRGYTTSQIPVAKALNHTNPGQLANTSIQDIIINLNKMKSYKYPIFRLQTDGVENFNVKKYIKCESELNIINNDLNLNLIPPNNYLPEYFDVNNDLLHIIYNCYKQDFELGGYSLSE